PVSVLGIVRRPEISDVVEQRRDDPEAKERCAEAFPAVLHALVAVHQPRHRERHVKHVLDVVIGRVAGVVSRECAAVHQVEITECPVERCGGRAGIKAGEYLPDFLVDRCRTGYIDAVRYVEVVAVTTHLDVSPQSTRWDSTVNTLTVRRSN